MQYLDFLIESLTIGSALILTISFAHYAWQRATANRTPVLPTTQPEPQPQPAPKPRITNVVVPFKRKVKPQLQLSDAELIKLAKQFKYPGSSKWGRNRRLSQRVRTELLRLAQQAA
jgi:hypothetical protein